MQKFLQNKTLKTISLFAAVILLQSCGTTKSQRDLNAKVSEEPTILSQQELSNKEENIIDSATNLTDVQKSQLNSLREAAREKSTAIEQQSMKLRELLVTDIVAADYDRKKSNEVNSIKVKMRKLDKERTNLTINTVEKAQKIMGREAKNNQLMMNRFLERDFDRTRSF